MRKAFSSIVLAASLAFSGTTLASFKEAADDMGQNMKNIGKAVEGEARSAGKLIEGSLETVGGAVKAVATGKTDNLEHGLQDFGAGVAGIAKNTYSLSKAVLETAYDGLFVLDKNTPAYKFWEEVAERLDGAVSSVDEKGFKFTADKLDELFQNDPVMAFVITSTLRSMGDAVYASYDAAATVFVYAPFEIAHSVAKNIYLFAKGFADGSYKNPLDVLVAVAKGSLDILKTIGKQIVRSFVKVAIAFKEIAEVFIGEDGWKVKKLGEGIVKVIALPFKAIKALGEAIFCDDEEDAAEPKQQQQAL